MSKGFIDKISNFNLRYSSNTMKNMWEVEEEERGRGWKRGRKRGKGIKKRKGEGRMKKEEREGEKGRKKNRLFPIIIFH